MPRRDEAGVIIQNNDENGLITSGQYPGTIPTTANKFAKGCIMVDTTTGKSYYNSGTSALPVWNAISEDAASEEIETQSVTATADGLTTGLIAALTKSQAFVAVTSSNAAHAVTLPAISADTIGQEIYLTVGSNGYELLTPASSNNTINLVDSDGTNQLDIAANTTARAKQVSATGWVVETIAATSIAITAPDND